ncbi:MAG TPA: DUF4390 domain-containing protein [Candidatus Sulfotelmatobacter sp.]|nr:DUF4390 domain-containing protein [Candidatus Sulfotelmatobacter sp.]
MSALPSPTAPRRRSPPRLLVAIAPLLLAALDAGPSLALDLAVDAPRIRSDTVWVDVRISNPFSSRVQESLLRGMPATLQLHSELWRRRTMWFARVEDNFDAELRIRFDVSSHSFFIERRGAAPISMGTLDSLSTALAQPLALPVGRLHEDGSGGRHFVVVTATLKPLSVEDVAEVESWLSGEVETQRHSGFGLITQVPASLFDAVRNLAGFGDDRVRAITEDFTLPELQGDH